MGAEITVTEADFQKMVLESPLPVLADFWAEWCMPCRMVAPILEKLAEEYKDKIRVAKINVDQETAIATRYNIISIPTILLFHKGMVAKQQVGAVPRQILVEMIKDYVQ